MKFKFKIKQKVSGNIQMNTSLNDTLELCKMTLQTNHFKQFWLYGNSKKSTWYIPFDGID
jgi:hypothetical protein